MQFQLIWNETEKKKKKKEEGKCTASGNRNSRGIRGIYTDPKVSQFSTEIDRNPIRRKGIRGALTMIKLDAHLYVDTRYLRLFMLLRLLLSPPIDIERDLYRYRD